MNTARELRMEIIETLFKIEDVKILQSIYHQLAESTNGANLVAEPTEPSFMEAVRPIRDKVSLEEIISEQNYKPTSYDEFRKKADKIEWKESLEDLLKGLD